MFLDQGMAIAGDYIDVHNLQGQLHLTVMGYPNPMKIAVTQGGVEISFDQEEWAQELIFDFAADLQTDIYIRGGESNHGTVTVLELEKT
jgi:hypothetical protein